MKKLSVLVILVLVAGMLVMPVLAASSATVTVSVSKNNVSQGDTFTVSVSTSKVEDCATGGFLFEYDQNVFEYVDGSSQASGFTLAGVSTANNKIAGYFMNTSGTTAVQGALFKITLKVKATAPAGTYTISGIPSLSVLNNGAKETLSASANSITVTVSGEGQAEKPTEAVTETTAATEAHTTDATEPHATDVSEATEGAIVTEAPTVEKVETTSTQETEILTIGGTTTPPAKNRAGGFPWWIIFAVMGIGSSIAIIVIKRKS